MTTWTAAEFQLDWLPGQRFAGYTDGSDWNGFERPYFSKPAAEALLRSCEASGYAWEFNEEADAFVVRQLVADEIYEESFPGAVIEVNGAAMRLYPIGAGSWIWGLADD
jgi:hypothetical protein